MSLDRVARIARAGFLALGCLVVFPASGLAQASAHGATGHRCERPASSCNDGSRDPHIHHDRDSKQGRHGTGAEHAALQAKHAALQAKHAALRATRAGRQSAETAQPNTVPTPGAAKLDTAPTIRSAARATQRHSTGPAPAATHPAGAAGAGQPVALASVSGELAPPTLRRAPTDASNLPATQTPSAHRSPHLTASHSQSIRPLVAAPVELTGNGALLGIDADALLAAGLAVFTLSIALIVAGAGRRPRRSQ